VLDPNLLSLVEYSVPSRNHNWGDCENQDCGLAQVFDFTTDDENIWFSEWAENKIGFIDTAVPLPFDVEIEPKVIHLKPGESTGLNFTVTLNTQNTLDLSYSITNPNSEIFLSSLLNEQSFSLKPDMPLSADIEVSVTSKAVPGEYNVLFGSKNDDVLFGKFLTVIIE